MAATMATLYAEFGAEVMVELTDRENINTELIALRRSRRASLIKQCQRCDMYAPQPAQYENFYEPVKFAIVVDQPILSKHLVNSFRQIGYKRTDYVVIPAAGCVMGPNSLREAQRRCRDHLIGQLDAADVKHVLICGAEALKAWRHDLALTQVENKLFVWQSKWIIMPIMHPETVVKAFTFQDFETADKWKKGLMKFAGTVERNCDVGDILESICIHRGCTEAVFGYDSDGVPWCKRHLVNGVKGKEMTIRKHNPGGVGQQELFEERR